MASNPSAANFMELEENEEHFQNSKGVIYNLMVSVMFIYQGFL